MKNKEKLIEWFDASPYQPHKNYKTLGENHALHLFHEAAEQVPAYKKFLKKHKIDHTKIQSIKDFSFVPQTSKENYVEVYPYHERIWGGTYQDVHMISATSGTTGSPRYWPRSLIHEIDGAKIHEYIFRTVFSVHEKKTLLINAFAMGNGIAGTFTLACSNFVAWKGYPLTIMTPGYSLNEVVEVIRDISPQFDQTIVAGHSPFLKEVLEEAIRQNIDMSSLDIKLLGSGQGISEQWRSYILKLLNADSYTKTYISIYGSADGSLMGFETPESIQIRRLIFENQKWEHVFSDGRMPSLYCYDPCLTFIQEENKELVITKDNGCPLIRYNIHDEGGICEESRIRDFLKEFHFHHPSFPLVYLFGRTKFMVKLYGANIYVEHVQQVFDREDLQKHITGRFLLEIQEDLSQNQILVCRVELKKTCIPNFELEMIIKNIFIEEIRKLNREYAYLLQHMKEKVHPRIEFHNHGDPDFFPLDRIKKTA
ncbi:MAG: hypothetical protein N3A54_04485 [Patescibacteria group bacterium]|nr:hypothetical protein [Patescibacteria group bacterium]